VKVGLSTTVTGEYGAETLICSQGDPAEGASTSFERAVAASTKWQRPPIAAAVLDVAMVTRKSTTRKINFSRWLGVVVCEPLQGKNRKWWDELVAPAAVSSLRGRLFLPYLG